MIAILAVLYLAAATAASTATPTGSVKGVVQDAGGTPIPGSVRVFISQALPANAIRAAAPLRGTFAWTASRRAITWFAPVPRRQAISTLANGPQPPLASP